MMDKAYIKKQIKKAFSVAGFAFLALSITAAIGQVLFANVISQLLPQSWMGSGYMWLETFAPMYAMAFPVAILILTRIPGSKPEPRSLSAKQFLSLFPLCFFLMVSGNLLGQFLSALLSGGTAENALDAYAMDNHPIKIVVMVILAPLLEELLCRKLLVDRVRVYGEKLAVLMSGLLFGLMHQNLFQFFYAFALGAVFAYIYLRTGKLRYTVILHAVINFIGSVLAPAMLSLAEAEIQTLWLLDVVSLLQLLYLGTYFGLTIAGLIMVLGKRYKPQWFAIEQQLPGKQALISALLNPGMIIYVLLCFAATVLVLLP